MEPIAHLHLACETAPLNQAPMKLSRIGRRSIQVLSAMVGCAIIGFTSAATAQLVLQVGDSGTVVSELQDRLRALGCFDGATTGFFGSQTRDAVIRCQQQRGITPDGVVGAETYRALGLGNPSPGTGSAQFGDQLQLGDRGPGVQELQTQLQARGYYYGVIDGVFGQDTQSAVLQLQRDRGLPQTGVVDAEVYAVLGGSVPPTPLPNPDPDGNPSIPQNSRRYNVIVPFRDQADFDRIRFVIPDAVPRQSRLGNYVNAGSYVTPEQAERRAGVLRSRGLKDARVVFQ